MVPDFDFDAIRRKVGIHRDECRPVVADSHTVSEPIPAIAWAVRAVQVASLFSTAGTLLGAPVEL
jgi:hypothetical protein